MGQKWPPGRCALFGCAARSTQARAGAQVVPPSSASLTKGDGVKRSSKVPLIIASSLVLGLLLASAASAAFPGENGRIVYQGFDGNDYEIYTIDPSGGTITQLTDNAGYDGQPAYSPDGKNISYVGETKGELTSSPSRLLVELLPR
jgi:hypothetical protein